jgi:hypothetical protein
MMDIRVDNHGSIVIFVPLTEAGEEWMGEHLPEDAQRWGGGIVVEPRYALDIVHGAVEDGLKLELR